MELPQTKTQALEGEQKELLLNSSLELGLGILLGRLEKILSEYGGARPAPEAQEQQQREGDIY